MTYPADIMKAAEQVAAYHPYTKHEIPELANNIARAIMAERQRCADIAWSRLTACQDAQYEDGAERVTYIAQAIERGDHV